MTDDIRSKAQPENHDLQLENGRLRAEVERLSKRAAELESLLYEFVPLENYYEVRKVIEAMPDADFKGK